MNNLSQHYPQVDPNPDFPKIEERILGEWKAHSSFEESVTQRQAVKNNISNEFIFYDGPPFANGLPHYGHLLTGFVKDLFARYQTMQGKRVERRFGWDCHGLPAEMGAEKDLGISGRHAIMDYGIGKFNDYCRTSVMKYTKEWEYYVTRQARWVDFIHDYKTMDTNYMESVIWAFKQLYDKGLVYEAYRVMPYSWAAETPLSNFETRLDNSYRERIDKAITVAFELKDKPQGLPDASKYYVLAWTTTPWTLPSNLALAAGSKIDYGYIVKNNMCYILAASRVSAFEKELANNDNDANYAYGSISAQQLIGANYIPLFPYFANHPNAFRILDGSDFVTDTDGTGIVHMAPGFGEDDQRVCEKNGIELVCPVDHAGKFTGEIFDLPDLQLKGLNVLEEHIEKYKFGEANERIIDWLKKHTQLIKQDQIIHNYPHCWRTDKPLIYKAVPSWYVEVTKFRDRMVELNQKINWIPNYIRDGLFGKWLENARDWSISRNRFWGTPIPIWRSKSGKIKVFGSIAELEAASGQKIADLHRPTIDDIVIYEDGEEFRRVEDVFDCWFESGSMPYAQVHYPFENKEWFEKHSPADFIVEYAAQTRGWFYTLMVLHAGVFMDHPTLSKTPPFKNCICHGVVLDDKGQKLSKRLNNYADPKALFDQFGADALRWFMISSPVMRGQELYIDKEGKFIRDVVRLAIKPIWNAYNFFCLYANADNAKAEFLFDSTDIMDRYILAKCKQAVSAIEAALNAYDTPTATEAVSQFFETLNNWYIRRNKERFWKETKDVDKQSAYNTLYSVLVIMCRAAAPLLPLTLEEMHKGLTGEASVHLQKFPDVSALLEDNALIGQMDVVRDICNAALSIRNRKNIRVRQPLKEIKIIEQDGHYFENLKPEMITIIQDEINAKKISYDDLKLYAEYKLQINFSILGKRLPDKIKQIIPASKKGHWKKLADGRVEVAGEVLSHEEFTILLEPKPEFKDRAQPLSSNDALVVLDINITAELEQEGYARDMVRLIQQARKDAGLHMTDRIELRLRLSDLLVPVLHNYRQYIADQVLASTLTEGDMAGCSFIANETIENEMVSIGFSAKAYAA
jgi:isoleucyl-tRNA synthetase